MDIHERIGLERGFYRGADQHPIFTMAAWEASGNTDIYYWEWAVGMLERNPELDVSKWIGELRRAYRHSGRDEHPVYTRAQWDTRKGPRWDYWSWVVHELYKAGDRP